MAYPVLGRAEDALENHETAEFLSRRLGQGLLGTVDEHATFTADVAPEAWVQTVELCRDEDLLAYDMFDCLFGVDAGEAGFDVVVVLYSTSRGRRILVRTRPEGGREAPALPTITHLFPGANWMERETWDMFGIEFPGHPALAPRILCVENFEGWPLRKDFYLTSRVAKPWPGVKEPAETDEDGNVIQRVPGPGEAPGPSGLDELMAAQAKAANPQQEVVDAESAAHTEEPPEREEVQLDQETFDRLIASGKSERIARSKAKAAYVKKQRAAGGETAAAAEAGTDTTDHDEPTTAQVEEAAGEREGEPGDGGKPGPSEADEAAAELEDVEEEASVRAEQQRQEQAEARAQKAAEQAEEGPVAGDEDDDAPTIPEGTPPAEDEADGEERR